jgi:uncharacterized protein
VRRDALALLWAMAFPSFMTWIYFVAAAGSGTQVNSAVLIAYFAGKVIQFGFPALYVGLTEPRSLRPAWPRFQGLAFGLAFGLIAGGAALGLYYGVLRDSSILQETPAKVLGKLREAGYASVGGFIGVASFISIVHSLLEEYYWRWFVFGWLKRHMKIWLAGVLASLAFAAHHVIVLAVYFPGLGEFFTLVLPLALGVAVGGGVWCWIYQRTGTLYAAWISHVLIDAAIMLIGYDMVGQYLSN